MQKGSLLMVGKFLELKIFLALFFLSRYNMYTQSALILPSSLIYLVIPIMSDLARSLRSVRNI